ncbi:hypothetical protein [Nakamurella lactea]|uniref:hypothetical protein n=1 Tax=Nakamurella lactea TaxID=459515 RepID=UPI00048F14A5|nr:hypothetical protein [Nakamurella lactea]
MKRPNESDAGVTALRDAMTARDDDIAEHHLCVEPVRPPTRRWPPIVTAGIVTAVLIGGIVTTVALTDRDHPSTVTQPDTVAPATSTHVAAQQTPVPTTWAPSATERDRNASTLSNPDGGSITPGGVLTFRGVQLTVPTTWVHMDNYPLCKAAPTNYALIETQIDQQTICLAQQEESSQRTNASGVLVTPLEVADTWMNTDVATEPIHVNGLTGRTGDDEHPHYTAYTIVVFPTQGVAIRIEAEPSQLRSILASIALVIE